jgi:quinohemoprotein ethanol dehydrogenase
MRPSLLLPVVMLLAWAASSGVTAGVNGRDWPGYGRTGDQQHFSPLAQINQDNVGRLGLAWSADLGLGNSATEPIAVNGVIYFATGLSVVHAMDASSGELLWRYDPQAAERAGKNLRFAWGTRGIAWWNGKIYTGTTDGRLLAIDAAGGTPVWSATVFDRTFPGRINGAPRICDGKVIIGFAGTTGAVRGFAAAYDAETGKELWRFYTVPGNPALGFESEAMEMAAKTWAGEWWRFGGGGSVWNAISCDTGTGTVFLGTGSGYPWNRRIRSNDEGDNLFISSIVAVDADSGAYRWHYQVNPGDTWDYDATMDIVLADAVIDGTPRKTVMQAPKNGFFYVLDRATGGLISAGPYAKVTWASRIDTASGRPVEVPGARYPDGATVEIWPSSIGAHSWMPMAYSPRTRLAYIPRISAGQSYNDKGIEPGSWRPPEDRAVEGALNEGALERLGGSLVAWSPAEQRAIWSVPYPTYINGGVLATGGGLVFQGTIDHLLRAYSAATGELLWSFDVGAPLVAPPITYEANGRQQVTVISGLGMGVVAVAGALDGIERYGIDPRTQARRVLTFALDGDQALPPAKPPPDPPPDPDYRPEDHRIEAGGALYDRYCVYCHGVSAVASMHAPDLRRSPIPLQATAFERIVRGGALVARGMPDFGELDDGQLEDLRQYIRFQAAKLRAARQLPDSRQGHTAPVH